MTTHNTTRVACADDSIRIAARALADASNALTSAIREVQAATGLIHAPEAAVTTLLAAEKLVGTIESMVHQIPRLALAPMPAAPAVQLRSSPQIIAPIDLIWTRGESGSYVAEAYGCKYMVSENGNEPSTSPIKWIAAASDTTEGHRWLSDGEPRCRDAKALCVAHANTKHRASAKNGARS